MISFHTHNNSHRSDTKNFNRLVLIYICASCLLLRCLTSQQQASVFKGSDNSTCCHTETEVADQTFHLIQSRYASTRLTSPSADLITPDAWQGSYWNANFYVTGMTRPGKIPTKAEFNPPDLPLSKRTP